MEFTVGLSETPFSLEYTLQSGQVFRWANRGEWWHGVVSGGVLRVRQEGEALQCAASSELLDTGFVRHYFRLDEDLAAVLSSIIKDRTLEEAVQRFYGTRLIRQDRWECLASFVLATNSNIPAIRRMVANVCARFGENVEFEGATYDTFPAPDVLAEASVADLEDCGTGYRAPFLKRVAEAVAGDRIDFSELVYQDYEVAREVLLSRLFGEKLLLGVGPKVADCVLLFSCSHDEAFPIDVWVARTLARLYPALLEKRLVKKLSSKRKVALTGAEYQRISVAARHYFGPYAGYAQQYLFMSARAEGR